MYFEAAADVLEKALSYVKKNGTEAQISKYALEKYGSLAGVFCTDINMLSSDENIGAEAAFFIKLAAEVVSRAATDEYKFGVRHTPRETDEYLKALLFSRSIECVYAISFDKKGRAIACDLVSEGVVNSSEILPRKIVEIAKRRAAAYMILSHNHPKGRARPSNDDMSTTLALSRILTNSGISLVRHVVVSGNDAYSIGGLGEL